MRKIEAFRKKCFDFRGLYCLLWPVNTAFDSDNLGLNNHICSILMHETRRAKEKKSIVIKINGLIYGNRGTASVGE